jgi:hypothetical protein
MQIAKVIELQAVDFVGRGFSTETREPPLRAFSRVFTQPGSFASFQLCLHDVRSSPNSGHLRSQGKRRDEFLCPDEDALHWRVDDIGNLRVALNALVRVFRISP